MSLALKAKSLVLSTHPIPSAAVASFALLFAVGIGLDFERVVAVGLAVLLQQFSVGLSNDWLDSERDKSVGRKDKPTASGVISISLVRNWSFLAALAAISVSLVLGFESGIWMVLMLLVGWAYNLGMKSGWYSVFPYAVGFGILPIFITLSFRQPEFPEFWIVAVAGLLGIAAHFANALPDLFDDKATGVRALPHVLGQRLSAAVIALTAVSASVIVVLNANELDPFIGWIGILATLALAGLASLLALRTKPPRIVFTLLLLASMVNVVLLMLGI